MMNKRQVAAAGIVSTITALGLMIHAPDRLSIHKAFAAVSLNKHPKDIYCRTPAAQILCDRVHELRTTIRPKYEAGQIATDYRRYIP